MVYLVYDGTFSGFLTLIFETYERKIQVCKIVTKDFFQADVFSKIIHVVTDECKSERVWNGLKRKISKQGLHDFYSCFLSEEMNIEQDMLSYFRFIFSASGNVEKDYGNDSVLKVAQTSRKVFREKHRFEAFIRFQLLKDGLYFAPAEPDFNILPLIIPHFQSRYMDQKWLIYDIKRKYGIYFDMKKVNYVQVEFENLIAPVNIPANLLHPEEQLFQKLWKDYFNSSNISSRKNLKLHLKHMPQRYWRYLTEKIGH